MSSGITFAAFLRAPAGASEALAERPNSWASAQQRLDTRMTKLGIRRPMFTQ